MRADVVAVDLVVPASDRYLIGAQLWHSNSELVPHTVALINAGAGIAQPYYRRFAEFLARSGIPTILDDYRGIGRSRPASLIGFIASVEQWGALDCTALLHLLALRYPGSRRLVIGHSVGAFVTGFATARLQCGSPTTHLQPRRLLRGFSHSMPIRTHRRLCWVPRMQAARRLDTLVFFALVCSTPYGRACWNG